MSAVLRVVQAGPGVTLQDGGDKRPEGAMGAAARHLADLPDAAWIADRRGWHHPNRPSRHLPARWSPGSFPSVETGGRLSGPARLGCGSRRSAVPARGCGNRAKLPSGGTLRMLAAAAAAG